MAENEVMEFAIEEMISQPAEEVLMIRITEVSQLIPNVVIDNTLYKALYDLNSQIVTKLEAINQVQEITAEGDESASLYLPSVVMAQTNVIEDSHFPANLPKKRRWGKYRAGKKPSEDIPVKCLTKKPERPSEEKRFKCGVCEFRAVRRDAVREHMKVHSDVRPYKCQFCPYTTKHKYDLPKHERVHATECPYKCKFCSYTTKHKYDLPKHERLHTGERPYKCTMCEHTARSASTLAVHKRGHTGDKPYQCGVCDYRGSYRLEVIDHYRKKHKTENSGDLRCTHCNFQGRTKFHLDSHIRIDHPKTQPLKCPICPFTCTNEPEMSSHVFNSHGLPKHQCKHCSFLCYDALKLKEHAKGHQAGESTIARCELCDQGVQHSENDGPEPYRCEKCDFRSSKCYELENHMKASH